MVRSKQVTVTPHWALAPTLPTLARTLSGVEFDPRANRWEYRDTTTTVSLNFAEWPTTDTFNISAKSASL